MTEKAKELINLLYADNLTGFGKIQLADLIEKQQNRIDELEKALMDEQLKHTDKINKLKDKLIGDKMEQFDDYIIYLIESYLEILEE